MSKFPLLLLDANIIICLHELHLWDEFIKRCDVSLTEEVVEEASYYEYEQGERCRIDLTEDIETGKIRCIQVSLSSVQAFINQFELLYAERMDSGEAESLAYLLSSNEAWKISSGDAIVFRTLGLMNRAEQGVSLEEILQKIGLQQKVDHNYTKAFREQLTKEGQQDFIRGRGFKENPPLSSE